MYRFVTTIKIFPVVTKFGTSIVDPNLVHEGGMDGRTDVWTDGKNITLFYRISFFMGLLPQKQGSGTGVVPFASKASN